MKPSSSTLRHSSMFDYNSISMSFNCITDHRGKWVITSGEGSCDGLLSSATVLFIGYPVLAGLGGWIF